MQLALGEGDGILMYLYPTEDDEDELDVVPWVNGYLEGVGLAEPAWEESGDPETVDELLMPFVVLAGDAGGCRDPRIPRDHRGAAGRADRGMPQRAGDYRPPGVRRLVLMGEVLTSRRRDGRKVGRNDPCPCGSGKKYKQCCSAS